jgi:hypothetical protein
MAIGELMRTALSKNDLAAAEPQKLEAAKTEEQSYTEQILKNIPAEVVAFYIPALGAAAAGQKTIETTYGYVVWVIFLLALAGTFVYTYKNAKKDLDKKVKDVGERAFWKAVIAIVAFFIWALYLGGPFVIITGYSIYGTLAILGFTFFTPAIYDAIPIPFPSLLPKKVSAPEETSGFGTGINS